MNTNASKNFVTVLTKFALISGLGVLLVVAAFAFLNSGEQQHAATLIDKKGEVLYANAGSNSLKSMEVEDKLYPGDQLVSGLEGGALLSLFEQGAVVEVYPNTSFTINEIGDKAGQTYAEVKLIQGEVRISTSTGVIGVRTNYGLAAVGGDSSVMVVTSQNISDETTVMCQLGSCAFQKSDETRALAVGRVVTFQADGAPVVLNVEASPVESQISELFPSQALAYPEVHSSALAASENAAEENQNSGAVSLDVLSEDSQIAGDETQQLGMDQGNTAGETQLDASIFGRSVMNAVTNGPWYLVSYGSSSNLSGLLSGTQISLSFHPDTGELTGFSGCNNYQAGLEDNGGDIKIKSINTTKTRCERTIISQEKTFLNILRKVYSARTMGGDSLVLYSGNGDQLVFSLNSIGESAVNTRPTGLPTETSAATPIPTATTVPTDQPASTAIAKPTSTSVPTTQPTSTTVPTAMPTATSVPTSTSEPPSTVTGDFYVSLNGNDGNPGTYDKPWRTIEKAADTLKSGQTAIVLAGTYPERVVISADGITLIADGKVQMKGFLINGDSNTVEGFSISDKTENAGVYVRGDSNMVKNNEIFHMKQDGIWFFGQNNVYQWNYIHDILDPSISSDIHADCFQTWAGYGPVVNTVFAGNTCDHNRTSGSNQIFMVEAQGAEIRNLVIRNNTFVMYDAGYSPLNVDRKDGQYAISGVKILNNRFENVSGAGFYPVRLRNVSGGEISGNVIVGYDKIWENDGSTNITVQSNTLQ